MWDKLFSNYLRRAIVDGRMQVHFADGHHETFGAGGDLVTVRLSDPSFSRKFLFNPDMAAGEAYMDGTLTIDDDDLRGMMALAIRNMDQAGEVGLERYFNAALRRFHQYNPVGLAQRNVAHHYDLSGELYSLFLDEDRQYSCAYFKYPSDTLEVAQAQKKAHIAAKLCLQPDMKVLDIGCGWGGMALTLARDYGCKVVGVTLSREQHAAGTARVRAAGLEDRVEIRLTDYREVREEFDRIVSVGMFEHVGVPHYREYFGKVRDLLSPDGVALIHTIGRNDPPGSTSSWIKKYIFPGGYVPALSEVTKAVEKEDLWMTDIEMLRWHYAETLKHWHDRFMTNIDRVRAIYDERFCRMWRFYLVGSEMNFRHARQVVFQVQLARRLDAVPVTRDYLYR